MFSRLEETGFFECSKHFGWFSKFPLWCPVVKLNNFFSGSFSCVGYFCKNCDHSVFFGSSCYFPVKICVGKSVSEWVIHFLCCTRNCLKITVSYIDIFCIIYIESRFMEVCCGWIIFQVFCVGIGQFTRWIYITAKYICCCKTAFHTTLQCHQDRLNFLAVFKPFGIYDTAYIHHYDYVWKCFFYFFYHGILRIGQAEIAIFKNLCGQFRVLFLISVENVSILCCFTFSVPSFA